MFQPSIIALDFETSLIDGTPSVDYYREDFKVVSCALAWKSEDGSVKTKCLFDIKDIVRTLERIQEEDIPVVVHNYAFDQAVIHTQFPEYSNVIKFDTMRLSQLCDNGGPDLGEEEDKGYEEILKELEGYKAYNGLSLENCISRLGDTKFYKHKEPFKKLMIERGGSDKAFNTLSNEEMREYNTLDAVVTLHLYEKTTDLLSSRKIDWSFDHELYKTVCKQTILAKCRGIFVNRDLLDKHIEDCKKRFENIEKAFLEKFSDKIQEIELEMKDKYLSKYKTEKGRNGVTPEDLPKFNINSTPQLKRLIIDKLGLKPKFFTKKGAPTFGAKLLWQYGEPGKMLMGRGKALIELKQGISLKLLSERDGKWHPDIKVASTRTGRLSGGSDA